MTGDEAKGRVPLPGSVATAPPGHFVTLIATHGVEVAEMQAWAASADQSFFLRTQPYGANRHLNAHKAQ